MEEDSDGRIWVAGLKGQVYIYDPKIDLFTKYKFQFEIDDLITNYAIIPDFNICDNVFSIGIPKVGFISIDGMGTVEIDSFDRGDGYYISPECEDDVLMSFETNDHRSFNISNVQIGSNNKYNDLIGNVLPEPFSGRQSRTAVVRYNDGVLVSVSNLLFTIGIDNQLKWWNTQEHVNQMANGRNGNPVLCFKELYGVRMYTDIENDIYETIFSDISASNFLEDKNGGWWIASTDKGLFYIRNRNIKYLSPDHQDKYYTQISKDNKGRIFSASYEGKLGQFNLKSGRYSEIYNQNKSEYIALKYDRIEDLLWFSTIRNTFQYDPFSNSQQIFNLFDANREKYKISATDFLFQDKYAWATSNASAFYLIERKNSLVKSMSSPLKNQNRIPRCQSIFQRGDTIYLGTVEGVYELQDTIVYSSSLSDSLLGYRTDNVKVDAAGDTYLATKGKGLVVWPSADEIYSISKDNGLLDNSLEDVELGDESSVWTASLSGINKIEFNGQEDYKIKQYTMAHGLPVPDIYDLEWYNGKLYAATGRGVIELTDVENSDVSPSPIITSFSVNEQSFSPDSFYVFSHDQNNIKIDFRTVNHKMAGNINYKLRVTAQKNRYTQNTTIDLVDLRPNNYEVSIESQNENGFWSEENILVFEIKNAWYNTWWFYFITALFLMSLGFAFIRNRTNQLKKEMVLQVEIQKLERAALKAQMNPHFIFNCLNSIQNFIMRNDKMEAMDYLSKFANLIRWTLNASVENKISLNDEVNILESYLSLEKLRFKNKFDYTVNIESDINQLDTYLSPMLIQPLVENAVKHGMADRKSGGKIEISFEKVSDKMLVSIRDNGNGFVEQNFSKKHESLGMSITEKRLGLNNKTKKSISVKRQEGWTILEIYV